MYNKQNKFGNRTFLLNVEIPSDSPFYNSTHDQLTRDIYEVISLAGSMKGIRSISYYEGQNTELVVSPAMDKIGETVTTYTIPEEI